MPERTDIGWQSQGCGGSRLLPALRAVGFSPLCTPEAARVPTAFPEFLELQNPKRGEVVLLILSEVALPTTLVGEDRASFTLILNSEELRSFIVKICP